MKIKHSILMITFNHKKYIEKSLESVINQSVKPYEIVIVDDFSTDGTRDILVRYHSKYPTIIKLHFNDKNLGIFENLNRASELPVGNVVSILAGDDWYQPGFIENMNREISKSRLNLAEDRVLLLPNLTLYYSDEKIVNVVNSKEKLSSMSPVGALLRGEINARYTGMTEALYKFWKKYPDDFERIGYWADFPQTALLYSQIDSIVLMDSAGPVYRMGVGVTSKVPLEEMMFSYLKALVRLKSYVASKEITLLCEDLSYLDFLIATNSFRVRLSFSNFVSIFFMAIRHVIASPRDVTYVTTEIISAVRYKISRFIKIHFLSNVRRVFW